MGQVNVKNRSGLRGITMGTRTLEDDRGVEHALHRQRENTELDEHARYALSIAEQVVTTQGPSMARMFLLVYVVLLILIVAMLVTGLFRVPYLFTGLMIGAPLTMLFIGVLLIRRRWLRSGPLYADVLLANGLCPVCAYRIDGLPVQEDGAVRCAECGAAWRHERIGDRAVESVWHVKDRIQIERFIGKSLFWNRRRIRDADGRERTLLDAEYPKAIQVAANADHKERLIEARRVLRRSARLRRLVAGLIAAFFLYTMFQSQLSRFPSFNTAITPTVAFNVLMGLFIMGWWVILGFYYLNPRGHSANKPTAIDEMLRRRVCPSCGGDMINEPIDERLRATCPRCRAVWRMPLILETLRDRARQTPDGVDEPGDIGD